MQQPIQNRIDSIEGKVKQLAKKMLQLQKTNAALEVENKKLKAQVAHSSPQNPSVQTKGTMGEMAPQEDSKREEKRSKQLKKEIAQHLKQIDKCIEWLENN